MKQFFHNLLYFFFLILALLYYSGDYSIMTMCGYGYFLENSELYKLKNIFCNLILETFNLLWFFVLGDYGVPSFLVSMIIIMSSLCFKVLIRKNTVSVIYIQFFLIFIVFIWNFKWKVFLYSLSVFSFQHDSTIIFTLILIFCCVWLIQKIHHHLTN